MPRPHLTPGKDPVPIVQEAGRASGPVWTGAENLTPTGIGSPDRPARRQSLYRLRYPDKWPASMNKIFHLFQVLEFLNVLLKISATKFMLASINMETGRQKCFKKR
jgi:hypothetical protein